MTELLGCDGVTLKWTSFEMCDKCTVVLEEHGIDAFINFDIFCTLCLDCLEGLNRKIHGDYNGETKSEKE